jgi:hypothetical protein
MPQQACEFSDRMRLEYVYPVMYARSMETATSFINIVGGAKLHRLCILVWLKCIVTYPELLIVGKLPRYAGD